MRPYLTTILGTLVDSYWLTSRTVRLPHGHRVVYSFRNPAVRQAMYDIATEKFRGATHLTVAEHLERECKVPMPAVGEEDTPGAASRQLVPAARGSTHQYDLLCAGYHYSLSGMPAWKTVEFLCRACDDMMTHAPVSKVAVEAAVKLVVWGSQLASTAPEVVVHLALVEKCRSAIVDLWPGTVVRPAAVSSAELHAAAGGKGILASCCLGLSGRQDSSLAVSDPTTKHSRPPSSRPSGPRGPAGEKLSAQRSRSKGANSEVASNSEPRVTIAQRVMSVMRMRVSDRSADDVAGLEAEEVPPVPLNDQLAEELLEIERLLVTRRRRLYREREEPMRRMGSTLPRRQDSNNSGPSRVHGASVAESADGSSGGKARTAQRVIDGFFAFFVRHVARVTSFEGILPEGGNRVRVPSISFGMNRSLRPREEQSYRQDLEEAEPWQRALIVYRGEFSKRRAAAAGAAARDAAGGGAGAGAGPNTHARTPPPPNPASTNGPLGRP
jgi:hypothetical protein